MTLSKNFLDLVSIGITTKNRWRDLQITLKKIAEQDLRDLPIIIFDDGSDESCPFDLSKLSLKIEYTRFTESKGLIVRRNQLAQIMQTKYYLSLDDDSYPVAGSLLEAIKFAESCLDLLCLSFPIYNPVLKQPQSQSIYEKPYQVKFFIGCGHLLHRQHFLELGGYREELIHQGEEMEIAARAFQKRLYCYHFPSFQVHHLASNAGRNWHRMDFYGARNNILWNDWFSPKEKKFSQQARTIISRLGLVFKVGRIGQIQGIIAAFKQISEYKIYRYPMTLDLYQTWRRLPNC